MDTNQRQPLIGPAAGDVVEECGESSHAFGGKAEATGDDTAVLEEEYYGIEKLCEMAFWGMESAFCRCVVRVRVRVREGQVSR